MAVIALLLLLLGVPASAHAYIDPSAGSVRLQLILGGVAGLMVALRLSWKRLTGLFGRGRAPRPRAYRDQSR